MKCARRCLVVSTLEIFALFGLHARSGVKQAKWVTAPKANTLMDYGCRCTYYVAQRKLQVLVLISQIAAEESHEVGRRIASVGSQGRAIAV